MTTKPVNAGFNTENVKNAKEFISILKENQSFLKKKILSKQVHITPKMLYGLITKGIGKQLMDATTKTDAQ